MAGQWGLEEEAQGQMGMPHSERPALFENPAPPLQRGFGVDQF